MSPYDIAALVTSIACALFKQCDKAELTLTASVFSQLGDTIATMLAVDARVDSQNNTKQPTTAD